MVTLLFCRNAAFSGLFGSAINWGFAVSNIEHDPLLLTGLTRFKHKNSNKLGRYLGFPTPWKDEGGQTRYHCFVCPFFKFFALFMRKSYHSLIFPWKNSWPVVGKSLNPGICFLVQILIVDKTKCFCRKTLLQPIHCTYARLVNKVFVIDIY